MGGTHDLPLNRNGVLDGVKGPRGTVRIPRCGTSLSEGASQDEILADFPAFSGATEDVGSGLRRA